MLLLGSIVNAATIIIGSCVGLCLHNRFSLKMKEIIFQGLGLCVLLIGMQMSFEVKNIILIISSILAGGIIGELLSLDSLLDNLGDIFKSAIGSNDSKFTEGLVTASLIYCIGAMAIVGSFDEGIRGDSTILFTKSILDGFASVAFAATYGVGVLFSFLPVFIYQACLTLFAGSFQGYFNEFIISQLTATGGLLILGIGINLLEIRQIRISSLLPSLLIVIILSMIFY